MIIEDDNILFCKLDILNSISEKGNKGTELLLKYWRKCGKYTKFPKFFNAENYVPNREDIVYLIDIENTLEKFKEPFEDFLANLRNLEVSSQVFENEKPYLRNCVENIENLKKLKFENNSNLVTFCENLSTYVYNLIDSFKHLNSFKKSLIETNIKNLEEFFLCNISFNSTEAGKFFVGVEYE